MLAIKYALWLPVMKPDHIMFPVGCLKVRTDQHLNLDAQYLPITDMVAEMIVWSVFTKKTIQRFQNLRDIRAPVIRIEIPIECINIDWSFFY